jgi:hypothetical protein
VNDQESAPSVAQFAMKAATASEEQVCDRMLQFTALALPVILELHTEGAELSDPLAAEHCRRRMQRIRDRHEADFVVHVPYQRPVVVLRRTFDEEQVRQAIEYAGSIGALGVVLHRYFGLVERGERLWIQRDEAEEAFNEQIALLAREYPDAELFVENLGFFWLRPRDSGSYLLSSLDHFFPWEMERFQRFFADRCLNNVRPMVDIAHAAISANAFNLARRSGNIREHHLFANVLTDDLDRVSSLSPYDFLTPEIIYAHISDALFVPFDHWTGELLTKSFIEKMLTSEGLPLGRGNLDVGTIVGRLASHSRLAPPLLVAEIEPEDGNHERNTWQGRAIRMMQRFASNLNEKANTDAELQLRG